MDRTLVELAIHGDEEAYAGLDGTVQGGWDFRAWGCIPSGVTRDRSPRNIYLACASHDGGNGSLVRLDQTGFVLNSWAIDGTGIAVTPEGTAAFVVSSDETTLSRYDLSPPPGTDRRSPSSRRVEGP